MKVDIWSDIRCPFCYIGKHKFEAALARFPKQEWIEVEWHSFELDPAIETDLTLDASSYLAARKGITPERVIQLHQQVQRSATSAGLAIDFETMVIANSFNGHRLIQLAKSHGLANEAEEALFKAQFVSGRNIDDKNTLLETGNEIGLDAEEITKMLSSDEYTAEVRKDETKAGEIGINGVPFFVFNNKYGVSGAQSPETFLSALREAWADFEKTNQPAIDTSH